MTLALVVLGALSVIGGFVELPGFLERLDPFGRAAPVRNPVEEKVLDIPVFLNRKAN